MNLTTRSLGLALLLLLLFLGATLTLQWWLARETRQLQSQAIEDQRTRLVSALLMSGRPPEKWDEAFQARLGELLGGSVQLFKGEAAPGAAAREPAAISFAEDLAAAPGWRAQVRFSPPALVRVQMLHQRALAVIVLLSLLVATAPLLVVLIGARSSAQPDGVTRTPWANARAQTDGLVHFARISNEQTAALAQEQGARQRAEEDLQVNRNLLDDSVASRVRLGRELHDNICQTLYAVCLTLESVQKKNTLAPGLRQRVDQCMVELRRLNQEVRAYLQDLEPGRVQGQSFAGAVAGMLAAFATEEGVRVEHRLDEEAVALIPAQQIAEIMNILREAVSNSLRHGRATHITLLAGRSEQEVALAVQDDGAGFVPAAGGGGHGLTNMQARAAGLGGSLRIDSAPGKGTRVLLTLPGASPA